MKAAAQEHCLLLGSITFAKYPLSELDASAERSLKACVRSMNCRDGINSTALPPGAFPLWRVASSYLSRSFICLIIKIFIYY